MEGIAVGGRKLIMTSSLPNVLFLPGLLDTHSMWDHQVHGLSDIATAVLLDLVNQTSVAESARWVLDSAPAHFALVGFSMGGYVALEILRQAPHRVNKLALISTSARADTSEKVASRMKTIERAESGGYETLVEELIPTVIHSSRVSDHELTDAIRTMALKIGFQAFVRQQKVIISRPDSRSDLARILCPTLVIVGKDDVLTPPSHAKEMATEIPNAELILIDTCSHYSPMEQPEIVTESLRSWLLQPG